MLNIPTILHNGLSFAKQNTSIILGGVAIGGVVLTAALTGKGVLEADARLKELAKNTPSPTTKEKVKAVLPCFNLSSSIAKPLVKVIRLWQQPLL